MFYLVQLLLIVCLIKNKCFIGKRLKKKMEMIRHNTVGKNLDHWIFIVHVLFYKNLFLFCREPVEMRIPNRRYWKTVKLYNFCYTLIISLRTKYWLTRNT